LSNDLDVPCEVEEEQTGKRLILHEASITLSLVLDENEIPTAAMVKISSGAEIPYAVQLFKVFRELGWTQRAKS